MNYSVPQKINLINCAEASLAINTQLHEKIHASVLRNQYKVRNDWSLDDLPFLEYFLFLQSEGFDLTSEFKQRAIWEMKRMDYDYEVSRHGITELPAYLCPFNIRQLKEKLSQLLMNLDMNMPFPYIHYSSQFIDLLFLSFRRSLSSYFLHRPSLYGTAVVEYDPYKNHTLEIANTPVFYLAYNFHRLLRDFIDDFLKCGPTDSLYERHHSFFLLSYPSSLLFLQGYIWEENNLIVDDISHSRITVSKDFEEFRNASRKKQIPAFTADEFLFYKKVAALNTVKYLDQEFNELSEKCMQKEYNYTFKPNSVDLPPKQSLSHLVQNVLLKIKESKKTYSYYTKRGQVKIDPSVSIEAFLKDSISSWKDASYLVKKMFLNTNVSLQRVFELDLESFLKKVVDDTDLSILIDEFKSTLLYIVYAYYILAFEQQTDKIKQLTLKEKPQFESDRFLLELMVYILFSFEILSSKKVPRHIRYAIEKTHEEVNVDTLKALKSISKKIRNQLKAFDEKLIIESGSDFKGVELLLKSTKHQGHEYDKDGDPLLTIGISKGEKSSFFNEKSVMVALYRKEKIKEVSLKKEVDEEEITTSPYVPRRITEVIKAHIKNSIENNNHKFCLDEDFIRSLSVDDKGNPNVTYFKDRVRDMKKVLEIFCVFDKPKVHQFSGGYSNFCFKLHDDFHSTSLFGFHWNLEDKLRKNRS